MLQTEYSSISFFFQVENRGLKLKSDVEEAAASTALDISAPSDQTSGGRSPRFLYDFSTSTEAEFLDVIGTKVLRVSSLLSTVTCLQFTNGFYPPPRKSGWKLVCIVNIVYGNLKYENSQDHVEKPQRNCTFMNSASGMLKLTIAV